MIIKLVAEIEIEDKLKAKLDKDYSDISYYFMQGTERDNPNIKVVGLTIDIV